MVQGEALIAVRCAWSGVRSANVPEVPARVMIGQRLRGLSQARVHQTGPLRLRLRSGRQFDEINGRQQSRFFIRIFEFLGGGLQLGHHRPIFQVSGFFNGGDPLVPVGAGQFRQHAIRAIHMSNRI